MGLWQWVRHLVWAPSAADKGAVLGARPAAAVDEANPAERHEQSLQHVCEGLRSGRYRNIVVMTGAGVSTAAGIPDFRSRAGMYSLGERFPELPAPFSVFHGEYFKANPRPLFSLIHRMMFDQAGAPAVFRPTAAHAFFALLARKQLLLRLYTQNIDCLDRAAGVPADRLVQVHGTMADAHCRTCGRRGDAADAMAQLQRELSPEEARAEMAAVGAPVPEPGAALPAERTFRVPRCRCGGVVRPDVVLFGEAIPATFVAKAAVDMPRCDLLLCLGSTFQVMPFAQLIGAVDDLTPRVLINREPVAVATPGDPLGGGAPRFTFEGEGSYRDVFAAGDCDETVTRICEAAGWGEDLAALRAELERSDAQVSARALAQMQEAL